MRVGAMPVPMEGPRRGIGAGQEERGTYSTTNTTNVDELGCVEGNEGPLCAVCTEGYYRPSTYSLCEPCGSKAAAVMSMIGILIGMTLALAVFVFINRRAPSGLLRPFINLVQTLTVMLLFDAPFPQLLLDIGVVFALPLNNWSRGEALRQSARGIFPERVGF